MTATVTKIEDAPGNRRRPWRLKIQDMAARVMRAPPRQETADVLTFRIPEPPPGVLPTDKAERAALAMDAMPGVSDVYGWANGAHGSVYSFREGIGFLGYAYLAELTQRAEYRRPCEIIAKEMTRKWITLTSSGDDDKSERLEELKTAMENFKLRDHFRQAVLLDGFFGRGHLYADTGATDNPDVLGSPLVLDKRTFRKGSLKAFRVVEPMWTYPNAYNTQDPLHEHFYKPQSWLVMGKKVHASRLLTFISRPVATLLKPAYSFGGLALTQMAKPYVDNWLRTRQNVSDTVNSFSKDIIKTNMSGVLQNGAADELAKRADLYVATRDNRGVAMLDKDTEDFANVSTPLGTLDKLQAQAQEQMAAVVGIPLVILLGITPSGLNASSDGEIKTFYAWIKAQQEDLFTTLLTRALHMIMLHLWGEIDEDIGFTFNDLWEIDETAQIANRKVEADTDAIYLDRGVIDNEECRAKLAKDENSPYHGLDLSKPLPDPPNDDVPDDATGGEPNEGEPRSVGENPPPKP